MEYSAEGGAVLNAASVNATDIQVKIQGVGDTSEAERTIVEG